MHGVLLLIVVTLTVLVLTHYGLLSSAVRLLQSCRLVVWLHANVLIVHLGATFNIVIHCATR